MKRPIPLLIFTLLLPAAGLAEAPADDSGNRIIESTKEVGSKVWTTTKEATGVVVDKSRTLYQSAKEKGGEVGSDVAEKSRSAWSKTKEVAGDAYESGKEMGAAAVDKAGEVGGVIIDKSRKAYDEATEEKPAEPAPIKSHSL